MRLHNFGTKSATSRLIRNLLVMIFCLVLVAPMLNPISAGAAETTRSRAELSAEAKAETTEMPDLERTGSISLTFTYFDQDSGDTYPVSGGNSVGLYKVANVVVDNGYRFELDERFASACKLPATTEELESSNLELAAALAKAAADYDYDKGPKKMDSEGKVSFDGLPVGLYLVVQAEKGTGDNEFAISPFLISLPNRDPDGSLNYEVNGDTKPLAVYKPEPEDKKPDKIPQTGQLWWPVAVLAAAGVVLLLIGFFRKYKK